MFTLIFFPLILLLTVMFSSYFSPVVTFHLISMCLCYVYACYFFLYECFCSGTRDKLKYLLIRKVHRNNMLVHCIRAILLAVALLLNVELLVYLHPHTNSSANQYQNRLKDFYRLLKGRLSTMNNRG